jgi:hypothetical protein
MMRQAQQTLTSSPIAATFTQPASLWWRSLLGDEDATAARALPSQVMKLAHMDEVGNLSKNEAQIWTMFTQDAQMTKQQLGAAITILEKLLSRSARRWRDQYEHGGLPSSQSLEEYQKGQETREKAGGEQQLDSDRWHKALDEMGIPRLPGR